MQPTIPARRAAIFWNSDGDIAIADIEGDTSKFKHLIKSGGACWGFWREASPEELYFRMLQQVSNLMTCEGVAPAKVHEAFCSIPEYRATLPRDHRDALQDDDLALVADPLPEFSRGYSVL
jgi:hypothetical protein